MMRNQINNRQFSKLALILMAVMSLSVMAQATEDGYALLIQASPPDGGTVTPGMGVFRSQSKETVMLSAKPKKGYRFMYWLGDVSSTSGIDTTVLTDSPKLVVAVFSREDFDENLPSAAIIDGANVPGGGRFINPIQTPGSVSPVGGGFDSPDFTPTEFPESEFPSFDIPDLPDLPDDTDDGDIPVPGDNDDIPVPGDNQIPEPATVVLFSMGAIALLRKRK